MVSIVLRPSSCDSTSPFILLHWALSKLYFQVVVELVPLILEDSLSSIRVSRYLQSVSKIFNRLEGLFSNSRFYAKYSKPCLKCKIGFVLGYGLVLGFIRNRVRVSFRVDLTLTSTLYCWLWVFCINPELKRTHTQLNILPIYLSSKFPPLRRCINSFLFLTSSISSRLNCDTAIHAPWLINNSIVTLTCITYTHLMSRGYTMDRFLQRRSLILALDSKLRQSFLNSITW